MSMAICFSNRTAIMHGFPQVKEFEGRNGELCPRTWSSNCACTNRKPSGKTTLLTGCRRISPRRTTTPAQLTCTPSTRSAQLVKIAGAFGRLASPKMSTCTTMSHEFTTPWITTVCKSTNILPLFILALWTLNYRSVLVSVEHWIQYLPGCIVNPE